MWNCTPDLILSYETVIGLVLVTGFMLCISTGFAWQGFGSRGLQGELIFSDKLLEASSMSDRANGRQP